MVGCLYTIAVIFVILWLFGFVLHHIINPLIHILIVVALVIFIYNMIVGNRRV